MKRKILLLLAAGVIFSAGIGVFAKHSEAFGHFFEFSSAVQADNSIAKAGANQKELSSVVEMMDDSATSSCRPVTDETAFDMFFIKVVSLERAAAKAKSRGESGNLWSNYLRREGFDDNEITTIRQVANQHAAEIAPLHARAVQIIRNGRETLARTGHLPSAPPELANLQEQRGSIATRNKNRLESILGAETVKKARELMKSKTTTTPVDPSDLMNSEDRMTQFRQRTEVLNQKEGNRND